MEKLPFKKESDNWQEFSEIILNDLIAGDRIIIDTSSRIYGLEVLEPGEADHTYVKLAIGKKNDATGNIDEWFEESNPVEIKGACESSAPLDEIIPVVEPELGILRAKKRAWYQVDRKFLGRRIDVVTGSIEAMLRDLQHG